ncbi:DUF6288 domain-containing protein, partial [Haloferula helveola]
MTRSRNRVAGPIAVIATLFLGITSVPAAPPDLTAGELIPDNLTTTWNLGPTGMRGWVYYDTTGGGINGSVESRQIQVREVDAGSPADGVFLPDDLILGASGTAAAPALFGIDARRALAAAIADAEAQTPADLQLIRWRAGVQTTVTLTLRTMGAYTATAPYSCPKSEKILEEGMDYYYNNESSGRYRMGVLSLLAAQDDFFPDRALYLQAAETEARALIKSASELDDLRNYTASTAYSAPWGRVHELILLGEYYLITGDALVFPTIEALAINLAKGVSHYGTMAHSLRQGAYDASNPYRPVNTGYGVVNSVGMPCLLGVQLAKQCGVNDPAVDEMIDRAKMFYASYVNRGSIPYGEHEAYDPRHENNGKCALAAIVLDNDPVYEDQAEFFVKMALASGDTDRDVGHTGAFFNYLWAPMGVQRGGPSAVQEYFGKISWMLDLHRRWDGGFDYDSFSENRAPNGSEYYNFRMSTAMLLTYALPLESLHITGRDSTGALALTAGQITDSMDVEDYDATARTTAELVDDLGVWSAKVRRLASEELGGRTIDTATRDDLRAKALDLGGTSRYGAIQAIGETDDTGFTGQLVSLLEDDDGYVRTLAAKALHKFHGSHKVPYRSTMMTTLVSRARAAFPADPDDPLQLDQAALITAIFGGGAFANNRSEMDTLISEVGSGLFFDALKVAARHPTGNARGRISNLFKVLTPAEVELMAPELVDMVALESPADRMFSLGVRNEAMQAMARSLVAEAVPAAMRAMDNSNGWGGFHENLLNGLVLYDGSSTLVTPDPDVVAFAQRYLTGGTVEEAQAVLDAIDADPTPSSPFVFKSIASAAADDPTVDVTANWTTLRVTATDLAEGDSIFTWTQTAGPGAVTITPNGTDATASAVLFDGTTGTYQFEVTMSDSRGLTEAYETVTVDLVDSGGPDVTPPFLDPAIWSSAPAPAGDTSITMTAMTAVDPSGVEYYFTCTSGGGNDSGWQDSPSYTDTGLTPGTTYGYTVTVRDKSAAQNTSAPSEESSGTTTGTAPQPPLKVFILAGQSNMEGHGEMNPAFSQGTLDYLVTNDPANYGHLKDGASWALRDDVWISYKRGGTTLLNGELSAGYGVAADTIGPELQFGVELGDYLGEQVLLIKTAWGGKSLYVDFRPPTSGWSVNPPVAAGDQGFWYQQMISDVTDALANLSTYFPDYATIGSYELAGFGWHQGWNDRVNGTAVAEYEANMENFINDVRTDLAAIHPSGADIPFVIATTGIGGPGETGTNALALMDAQLAMEDFVKYPAFEDNVAVVDTREFWREASESPADQGYHWNRNAESYFLIGQSMATHMRVLLDGGDTTPPDPSPLTWATTPTAAGEGEITMAATTATDIIGVEYYFEETSGNPGGDDSGWQNSPTYLDTGLNNSTSYSYRVKARDKSPDQNETAWSTVESTSTTPADTTAPTPNPVTWAIAPTPLSSRVITMTATTASDPSGVEYYFTNTTISGHESGWQDSPKWTDVNLDPSTSYTYEVKARDKAVAATETAPSAPTVATTLAPPPPGPLVYEPFDDLDPTLNGNTPGLGLSGTWSAASAVSPGSLSYGSLATSGGRVTTGGGQFQQNGISPGTTLTDAGLMVDGSTLWFSALIVNYNSDPAPTTDNRTYLALGTGNADGFDRIGGNAGSGFTVAVSKVSPGGVTAQAWNDGSDGTGGATRGSTVTVADNATFLAVGKITWGEFGVEDDVFELYLPGTDLVQGAPISTIAADFDQLGVADPANAFNTISFTGGRPNLGVPEVDEIRFGATYADVVVDVNDTTAPTPDPMTWASVPVALGEDQISMTASTASDASGVEYYFDETSGNPGGTDSGWQDSATYIDTGLDPSTTYSYQVRARDKSSNNNETGVSSLESATTTVVDNMPPTPDPMTWVSVPAATSDTTITMTASTASDPSGVEYYFEETTGNPGGDDSGWQDSAVYIDTGLDPSTTYSYQVKARDKSPDQNETGLSPLESATTDAATGLPLVYEPFADLDSTLSGNTPGLGLTGTWNAEALVADSSLTYGKLGYQGGRATANPGVGNGIINNEISPGSTLTDAGLMNDGATLWVSALIQKHPDTSASTNERTTYLALGTGGADGFDRIGGNTGSGFTFVV